MNIHRFLFYLLLVLLPTQLTKYFFPEFAFISGIRVDYLAPVIYVTDIVVLGVAIAWIPNIIRSKRNYFANRIVVAVCVCLIAIAINIFVAVSPTIAFLKWIKILEALFVIIYVAVEKLPLKNASIFLLTGGIYSCLLAWLQFILQSSVGGIFWWIGERTYTVTTPGIARLTFNNQLFLRPYATFPHPNVLAGFVTCLIPIIFYIKNLNRYTELLFVPILILFLATILITFSQIAWIIAIVTTSIFILKEKSGVITTQKIASVIMAALILIFVSYQFVEKESISRRVVLMSNALSIIREHPLLGVGLNNFIIANQQQTIINSYQDLQPVHSIYLLFVSEAGIVGILLAILLVSLFYKKVRINKTSFYFMWSLGTLYIFGLFDHYPLTIHQTLLLGSVFMGFILASSRMVKF